MDEIKLSLSNIIDNIYQLQTDVEFTRPDAKFGDLATNVAMQLGKKLEVSPKEVATRIAQEITNSDLDWLQRVDIAGPGFINFTLKDQVLIDEIDKVVKAGDKYGTTNKYKDKSILVEYLDPNPFKEIHIGHAYSGTVGDAIAQLYQIAGGNVHRVTYQGDVGLHVAKAIFGIIKNIDSDIKKFESIEPTKRPIFLGEAYAEGATAYEKNEDAKSKIQSINKKIYEQNDPLINNIHKLGKAWSFEYFDQIYNAFGFTTFEKNYLESMVAPIGINLVNEHIKDGIFTKSDGAVIFKGEQYGLHTRVFINSLGLPTYEAKDLGNAVLKWQDYKYDKSIIITGQEQADYFKVMLKALEQFAPELSIHTTHISHGIVTTSQGKMSSRTGQVVRALDLLESVESEAKKISDGKDSPTHDISLAAIKYAFLKNRIGGDIIYNLEESLSLEGNSGPYIQYAHARAQSILAKSDKTPQKPDNLDKNERALSAKIGEFIEVVNQATEQLAPHIICTYLYELAQLFNRFYEYSRIIGDERETQRLMLIKAYSIVLKNGLSFINISSPAKI